VTAIGDCLAGCDPLLILLLPQEQEAWHARFHQLRHFKHIYHHISVAGHAGAAAAAAEGAAGASATAAGDSSAWVGLAQWLTQQQLLLGEPHIEVVLAAAVEMQKSRCVDGSSSTNGAGGSSSSRDKSLRRRLLRSLGVRLDGHK
jgi:hypothetical protein